ncbi:hypothetical protein Krac_3758 [Ktedonobacter racemifer DSM 44963]|uniref:Uncharacterized protein n=1 Tax=Ktedonobacter racemifer DSM 44963 TaxID=485913 RepID=D6U2X8_KTERA|nr:hypothetical protein Krac_3758 [Ktedonobacter racemifer DSM 44963]
MFFRLAFASEEEGYQALQIKNVYYIIWIGPEKPLQ